MKDKLLNFKRASLFPTLRIPELSMPEYGLFLIEAVERLKEAVRTFFYQVMLSQYACPNCGSSLVMEGTSLCRCLECDTQIDPTIEFQQCDQCGGDLVKKTFHYHCKACHSIVQSRFLFDERLFDSAYFTQMMRESRERKRQKRAQIEAMLRESRSDVLVHEDYPDLGEIDGLSEALDNMVNLPIPKELLVSIAKSQDFDLNRYKEHILGILAEAYEILFDDIEPLMDNVRKDRAFRFVTLIFMNHWKEVELVQYGEKLVVEKIEAHCEG